ncbi:MAG: hypothetical protein ACRD0G_11195, partial [Acidimicrobiales bacterium]
AVVATAGIATVAVGGWSARTEPADDPMPACPATTPPAVPPGGVVVQGDHDGDGCPTPAVWADGVLTIDGQRYGIGRPGDEIRLGDWDCDGIDTPRLFRPATGGDLVFNQWPTSELRVISAAPGTEITRRPQCG